ncbi:hypothetical protein Hokovirus_3_233 [Hokovirus HKV1]|uniref:Uncharacterized protein n=1 Tax=Hokovirus HKV1 TaxID=1977638 RepID=A0A1V0SGW4_9VIRU|nr:hypothetical protein Hokovirus_3_233 [Hokovirus HKV1]
MNKINNNYYKRSTKIELPEEYKKFLVDREILSLVNELPQSSLIAQLINILESRIYKYLTNPDLKDFDDKTKVKKLDPCIFNRIMECIFLLDFLNYQFSDIQRISILITIADLTSIKNNDNDNIHLVNKKNIKYDYDKQKINVLTTLIDNNYHTWIKLIFEINGKYEKLARMPFEGITFVVKDTIHKYYNSNSNYVMLNEKAFYHFLTYLYESIYKGKQLFFTLFYNNCFLNYKIDTIINNESKLVNNKSIEWHYFNNKKNLLEQADYKQILPKKKTIEYVEIDIKKQMEQILLNIINYCSYNTVIKNVAIIDDLITNHNYCFDIITGSLVNAKPLIILHLIKKLIEFEKYEQVKNIIMRCQNKYRTNAEEYDIIVLIIYDLLLTKYKDQELLDSLYNFDHIGSIYRYQMNNINIIHLPTHYYEKIIKFYDYDFNIKLFEISGNTKNDKFVKFCLPCLSLYLKHDKMTSKYLYKIYTTSNLDLINSVIDNYNVLPDSELLTNLCIHYNTHNHRNHLCDDCINIIKSIFTYKVFPQNDILNIIYQSNNQLNTKIASLLLNNGLTVTEENCVLLLHSKAITYNDLITHNIEFNENIYYKCYEKNALLYDTTDVGNISTIFKLRSICVEKPRTRVSKTKNKNNFVKLIKDKKILPDRYCYEFACYSKNTDIIEIFEKLKCVPTPLSIYYTLNKNSSDLLNREYKYYDTKIKYILCLAQNIQTQEYMNKPYSEFENFDEF